jgi:hypothetical protein
MIDETKARWMRTVVKTIFIGCFAAFMLATVRHLAIFFNGFEQGADTIGSYLLAGAFDLTALVTTIAVMFFRKSMPRTVQALVWFFILCITAYSFFINWEYTAHYQSSALILQPTGAFQPVYDASGVLHYVPVMRANTALLFWNPILASGFTAFALIYSIVAEFFGTKPPSVEELQARKTYLEETRALVKDIANLEGRDAPKPGLLERSLRAAKEVKSAVDELRGDTPKTLTTGTTIPVEPEQDITEQDTVKTAAISPEDGTAKPAEMEEENRRENARDNVTLLPMVSGPSMTIAETAARLGVTERHIGTLLKNKKLQHTPRNTKLVLTSSVEQYEASRQKRQETAAQKRHQIPAPVRIKNNTKKTRNESIMMLDFVGEQMYAELTKNPDQFEELMAYADAHGVEELVDLLKSRYANYAAYFTMRRVGDVLAYARQQRGEAVTGREQRESA